MIIEKGFIEFDNKNLLGNIYLVATLIIYLVLRRVRVNTEEAQPFELELVVDLRIFEANFN